MKLKKTKEQFLRFLINVGTSGKYSRRKTFDLSDSDYLIRYVLMNCIIIFGLIILIAFAVGNIRNKVYSDAIVCLAMALVTIVCFILARSKIPQSVSGSILYISYGLMCIVLIQTGEAYGANYLFIYMFPSLAILQLRMYYGAAVSALLIIVVSMQMFVPGLSHFNYQFEVFIRMLVGYILVFFVTIVIEITRKTKDRLILTQNRWLKKLRKEEEEANRMLELAVWERTQELEEQTKIAIQASLAKSEFLATMSHEIRTPLNAVIGLSEIELQGDLSESSKNNIQQIYQSGTSLLGIINEILDISKIEAGGFKLVPVEYETAPLISDTVNLNRVRLGTKPIKFVLEINGDFPRKLFGDELRVRQVLNNLLSNAIKYTQKGTVTLTATWENSRELTADQSSGQDPSSPPGEQGKEALLRFKVKDTGSGIRREDIGKLFSNYAQLNTRANRKVEGTGLGLVITKNLVEMMGGSITVESEYEKGTVFTVEIKQGLVDPLLIGEETAESLRSSSYVVSRKEGDLVRSWMPRGKVLVVDDMSVNLHVAKGLLKPYGLQIDTASSGQEAIEMVKAKNSGPNGSGGYDLVFMDHMMPGMDGIEAMSIIRAFEREQQENDENPPNPLPIIVLTANAIVGMKEMFIGKGFNDFLTKPIDISKLDGILVRWMPAEKQKKETENEKKLVILTDDNLSYLRQGKDILSEEYSVVTTPSAAKLFSVLKNSHPALILLDADMPDMDGNEAIKILKSKPETKDIPVIILIETAEEKDRVPGAADYIFKPFDPAALLACINKHKRKE